MQIPCTYQRNKKSLEIKGFDKRETRFEGTSLATKLGEERIPQPHLIEFNINSTIIRYSSIILKSIFNVDEFISTL